MLSDDFIQELISCPKKPLNAERKKLLLENRHYKNNIALTSIDGKYQYKMFMRKSDEFIEDFSIGLIWTNANEHINISKSIILLRCQGPHDGKQPLDSDTHHSYHTHTITIEDIANRRYQKPSNREITDKFHSYDQALLYFIKKCGIINLEKYIELPEPNEQCALF